LEAIIYKEDIVDKKPIIENGGLDKKMVITKCARLRTSSIMSGWIVHNDSKINCTFPFTLWVNNGSPFSKLISSINGMNEEYFLRLRPLDNEISYSIQ